MECKLKLMATVYRCDVGVPVELSIAQPRSLKHFSLASFYGPVDGPESGAAVKPTTAPDKINSWRQH